MERNATKGEAMKKDATKRDSTKRDAAKRDGCRATQQGEMHRSVNRLLWSTPTSAGRHFLKRIKSSTPSSKTEMKEILLRDFPIVPRTDNPRKTWMRKVKFSY